MHIIDIRDRLDMFEVASHSIAIEHGEGIAEWGRRIEMPSVRTDGNGTACVQIILIAKMINVLYTSLSISRSPGSC